MRLLPLLTAGATLTFAGCPLPAAATPAASAVTFDFATNTGFVGAADLTRGFGWKSGRLIRKASEITFQSTLTIEETWSVTCDATPFTAIRQQQAMKSFLVAEPLYGSTDRPTPARTPPPGSTALPGRTPPPRSTALPGRTPLAGSTAVPRDTARPDGEPRSAESPSNDEAVKSDKSPISLHRNRLARIPHSGRTVADTPRPNRTSQLGKTTHSGSAPLTGFRINGANAAISATTAEFEVGGPCPEEGHEGPIRNLRQLGTTTIRTLLAVADDESANLVQLRTDKPANAPHR